jgi:hypothetical protein
MRTKNKMKNSEVKFKEWWEVAKEYFTKELEKNLVQHIVDERILKYKLEAYNVFLKILFLEVDQVRKYQAMMWILK